jgi:hypothetical protein
VRWLLLLLLLLLLWAYVDDRLLPAPCLPLSHFLQAFTGITLLLVVLLQAYVDIKKRLHGAPTSGKVSLVVTDIESYSGESLK